MSKLTSLTSRHMKLFFKDKGLFFSSLITPIILLVLYATFLGGVYKDSFTNGMPEGFTLAEKLINGCVGSQLFSSLLAVSCVTVTFCANLIMIQDKSKGSRRDLTIAPVNGATLGLSYYLATALNALIVCFVATGVCFIYLAIVGWYLALTDVLLILLDVVLLVMFGTALSSLVCYNLSTEGQASAVGTIISAGYGFICGAYMPISSFGEGLQKVLGFLPGTYGTSMIRNHAMNGVFNEMQAQGVPAQLIDGIKESVDCKLSFFGNNVSVTDMMLIVLISDVVLIAGYAVLNAVSSKKAAKC